MESATHNSDDDDDDHVSVIGYLMSQKIYLVNIWKFVSNTDNFFNSFTELAVGLHFYVCLKAAQSQR